MAKGYQGVAIASGMTAIGTSALLGLMVGSGYFEPVDHHISGRLETSAHHEAGKSSKLRTVAEQDRRLASHADLRSAIAAEDSAFWAKAGTWVSAVSSIFVLMALYAAFRSNSIARDTARRQLRAYISLERVSVSLVENAQPVVTSLIKNTGQTPAYKHMCSSAFYLGSYPPPHPIIPDDPTGPKSEIGPSALRHFKAGPDDFGYFTKELIVGIGAGTACLIVSTKHIYEDAFGGKHWLQSKVIMGGPAGHPRDGVLSVCDDGNESSDG